MAETTPHAAAALQAAARLAHTLQPFLCLDPATPPPVPSTLTDAQCQEALDWVEAIIQQWLHTTP
jgi:hypothetical protein